MFVATKASALKGIKSNSCETVTFHNKSKKTPKSACNEAQSTHEEKKKSNANEVGDMKKLRYEIIKFGTSGFSGTQKEDANIALMVSLGAEPPKKKAKNYKEILTEKRKLKQKPELQDDKYKVSAFSKKRANCGPLKNKRKKDFKGLLNVYGEVNKKKKFSKRKEKG